MADPAPAKSTLGFLKYTLPIVGTVSTGLALSGKAAAIAGGTPTLSAYFSAASYGLSTFASTLLQAGTGIAATVGALPALGIAAALLGGFWYMIGKPTTIKGIGTSLINQFHPIESAKLGAKGRLGSNLWQMPLLYFVASGIIGATTGGTSFLSGMHTAALDFWGLMTTGFPSAESAASVVGSIGNGANWVIEEASKMAPTLTAG